LAIHNWLKLSKKQKNVFIYDRERIIMKPTKSTSWFTRFAKLIARKTGQPIAFMIAVSTIII